MKILGSNAARAGSVTSDAVLLGTTPSRSSTLLCAYAFDLSEEKHGFYWIKSSLSDN